MKLSKVIGFFVAMLAGAEAAEAAMPKLQVRPAIPVGYAGEVLRLKIDLPCGSKFYGLIAEGDHKTGLMQVAAAVTEEAIVCTSMPETVEVGVDYLAIHAFRKIAPMALTPGMRIVTVGVDEVRAVANGPQTNVYAIYTPRCGRELGTLIHRVGRSELEIARIERNEKGGKMQRKSCTAVPKTLQLNALGKTVAYRLRPLAEHNRSLVKAFSLHLAPVRNLATAQGLSFEYQRDCKEAPVGVVVGKAGPEVLRVGMLVARFPNMRCAEQLPTATWTTVREPALAVANGALLTAAQPEDHTSLHMRSPTNLTLARDDEQNDILQIRYIGGCGDAYAVYAQDGQGMLAVGVLDIKSEGDSALRCHGSPASLWLSQPVAAALRADQIYPLRLKGL